MAAEANNIIRYMITGEESRDDIPRNATHVSVHPSVTVIREEAFYEHPNNSNIVELICHDGVIKIKEGAFCACPRLKRVIMKGVEEVESEAFEFCQALEYVECDKLEIIRESAFSCCESMTSFNLPSAKIVEDYAFGACPALVDAVFGHKLDSIGENTFYECRSLERITIPLKNGLIGHDNVFQSCENLRHVDLVDKEVLQQTIDTLLWEEWKNDMNTEVVSIDQILPNAYAGDDYYNGEKAVVLRRWIATVLRKIIKYKSQHRCLMKEAEYRLQLALPHDIVMNNVVPFLKLPQHTFDGEEESDESDYSNESIDESYSSNVGSNEEDSHDDSQEGAADTGGERKQEVISERSKRQRIENNDDDVDGHNG